jgi:hypothetical protein
MKPILQAANDQVLLVIWIYICIHICISLTFQPKIVAMFNQKHCESCDMLFCKHMQFKYYLYLKNNNQIKQS